jgi:hypothetical protein
MKNIKLAILCYDTINIGDEIQSLAMKKLLPRVDYYVTRDNMSIIYDEKFNLIDIKTLENTKIYLFINGWFAEGGKTKHTSFHFPIPSFIHPLFISIYMTDWFIKNILDKNIEYFKKYEPIGCRDKSTYKKLISRGLKAEFVGCVTLTFENSNLNNQNNGLICLVDCSVKNLEKFIKIEHCDPKIKKNTIQEKFTIATDILEKYKFSSKVYTSRLHCYLPCKAMKKDVVFVGRPDERFEGLINLSDKEYEDIKITIKNRVNQILSAISL